MEDSTTYQAIIRRGKVEGRLEEARTIIARQGKMRFGVPNPSAETALASIHSVERLEQLAERLLQVENWEELLAQ